MIMDPNRKALDADPDPDPPKWRRSDQMRSHNTVCTYPNKQVVRFKLGFQKFIVNNIVKLSSHHLIDNIYRKNVSINKCFWNQKANHLSIKLKVKKETLLSIIRMKI